MNVTIIGTGNMGKGIGTRLAQGGHQITLVGKDKERTRKRTRRGESAQYQHRSQQLRRGYQ